MLEKWSPKLDFHQEIVFIAKNIGTAQVDLPLKVEKITFLNMKRNTNNSAGK